ncbi:PssD/Cps14F family polysaccharide biosynthesis glycosyltransferase [Paenibacillus humicola]|uniref:PssD/Cps14F family polysaccharide biosynthesis glycosyltransferase n=1 Tax=Paenibacillus humicola TaxID=3110540 RepID=UPI00237B85C5|nr:PssD/Cps14F family polysaccharide biosynthesis glycosyltransferase [Paenibacillus humicola]
MKKNKDLKICLICSTGGHLAQMKEIIPVVKQYRYILITEKNKTVENLRDSCKTYFLVQQERKNILIVLILFLNVIKSIYFFVKEQPDIIISTGAGAVIPFCFLGKLFRKKIMFIESFAKIKSPTLTGQLIYRISDKFYVQWEELLKFYPKAEYRGKIY